MLLSRTSLTVATFMWLTTDVANAVSSLQDLTCTAEYVVIGGGCAGGILASRLATAGRCVVLLERGVDSDYDVGASIGLPGIDLSVPYWHFLANSDLNPDVATNIWLDKAWPEDVVDNAARQWSTLFGSDAPFDDTSEWQYGFKILGGGSMANAMVYNRGNENIFKSWGWDDAWPKYDDLEAILGPFDNSQAAAAPEAFVALQAFQDVLGWQAPIEGKLIANGEDSLVGFYDKSIKQNDGNRSSVPSNFFTPGVRALDNFAILLQTQADKIVFDNDKRATGVLFTNLMDGTQGTIEVQREVIVSAGPYLSPQLLMKSGIGPEDQLQAKGIGIVQDTPAVGQNYKNHLFIPLVVFLKDGFGEKILNPDITFNGGEFIGHWYSDLCVNQTCDAPDMQTAFSYYNALGHYLPLPNMTALYEASGIPLDGIGTANLWTMLTQPSSTGFLEVDPDAEFPTVHANFLSMQEDIDRMVDGVKKMRKVALSLPDFFEETNLTIAYKTDEEWIDYVKRFAMGQYHPAGTCKLGGSITDSVVGRDLKVHGITGLRVVDSSIMPRIQNGNTAAASMLIGYHAADLILQEPVPSASPTDAPTDSPLTGSPMEMAAWITLVLSFITGVVMMNRMETA